MCRFVAYIGNTPLLLKELLEAPENSLISQSRQAKKSSHIINADGFGIAWYDQNVDSTPGVFKSIQPAWNDKNLLHLSHKVRSKCFLGHVRASTVGDVTLNNCHPFTYKDYTFVHNGTICHFDKTRRALTNELDDHFFNEIKARTDSEHLFALMMHFLHLDPKKSLEGAMKRSFEWVVNNQKDKNKTHFSRLNICITDGKELISTRYATKNESSFSLYYATKHFEAPFSEQSLKEASASNIYTVIASEPLSDYTKEWKKVPANHYIHIQADQKMHIKPF
ncbi:MAG TPA: class II glutamine amidotransferase [Holosporales bacterium]|nr:class II glutamine amidotransferase [Holosporales bacterium]